MRSKLLGLTAAAATIAVLWSVLDSRSHEQALHHDVQRFQAEIDELKGEFRHRTNPVLIGNASPDVESLARQEARAEAQRVIDSQTVSDDARSPEPPPVSFEQSQAAVFEAFGQEDIDPQWKVEATRKLDAAVRDRLPTGSRLGSIECHTTMCRVEVFHHDPHGAQAFVMDAFRDWRGSLFVAKDRQEGGEHVVTIIASREGHELPLAPH